jgi:anthranilate phosphoribosyltransferase
MQRLGVEVDATPAVQARCLDEVGICFCFAIHHHPAAKHVMPVRKALGLPTIFNLLGPLTNPAGAGRQVMGVYAREFVRPVAESLVRLGSTHALVFHSDDGLDEISVGALTRVAEVRGGEVHEWVVDPSGLGLEMADPMSLAPDGLDEAAELFMRVIRGKDRGARRSMVLVNAAAALLVAGRVRTIDEGVVVAGEAIDQGRADATLKALCAVSRGA